MMSRMNTHLRGAAVVLGLAIAAMPGWLYAQAVAPKAAATKAAPAFSLAANSIGGVVMGVKTPEAGVWVIAETTDLPTKFARIVVTDDRGRYVISDLPTANYSVWVRAMVWSIPQAARQARTNA
ncbi:MAG: carboxypeptidase regulatory-like domain-containing protein [Betaproteobacteria bacterium]|nr:carboxypeptidase regulatory-like domain-containing protein [Betaproteobacteria bacterium]